MNSFLKLLGAVLIIVGCFGSCEFFIDKFPHSSSAPPKHDCHWFILSLKNLVLSGILYKAVLTGGVVVLINRSFGLVVTDILNPPSIPPKDCVLLSCGLKKLAGRNCQQFFQSRTSLGGYDGFHGESLRLFRKVHHGFGRCQKTRHMLRPLVLREPLRDSRSDTLESRPTTNLFELWEDGSQLLRLMTGRNYCFPRSLVVPCACLKFPNSLSLRDAVLNVAHHSGQSTTRDGVPQISLKAGIHFPDQAIHPGSTESDSLTFRWGVTLCLPEWNDISLVENAVIEMRAAAMRELKTNSVTEKPTTEKILEFNGPRMECTVESTPHANTQVYSSTYEGAGLIPNGKVRR